MKKALIIIIPIIIICGIIITVVTTRNKKAQTYAQQGLSYYDSSDYENAIHFFSKSLKIHPQDSVLQINLAKALFHMGDCEQADSICDVLITQGVFTYQAKITRVRCMILNEQYAEAISSLTQLIEADNTQYLSYYYRGIAYANTGNFEMAIADYEKADELQPDDAELIEKSVIARTKLDDYEGAIKDYDKLLSLNSSSADAWYMRGYLKMKLKDYEAALTDLSQAIELNDTLSRAYYYRGFTQIQLAKFEQAISDFEMAHEMQFKPDASLYNAGKLYVELKEWTKAQKTLAALLTNYPESEYIEDAFKVQASISFSKQDFNTAHKTLSKAIEAFPSNADFYYYRALASENIKDHKKAIEDLSACMKLGMNTAEVYYSRGVQYINIYQYDIGCKDLQTAVTLGSEPAIELVNNFCKNR